MAKKKRSGSRRRKGKRGAPKKDYAYPAGLLVGGSVGISDAIIDAKPTAIWNTYTDLSAPERLLWIVRATGKEMMTPDTYTPIILGALVSASPKIPVVRMLAKPADRAIRRLSKGKVSL